MHTLFNGEFRWPFSARSSLLGALLILGACGSSAASDADREAAAGAAEQPTAGSNAEPGAGTAATGGGGAGAPAPAVSSLCGDPPANLSTSKQRSRSCSLGDDAPFFARAAPYSKVVIEIGSTVSATPSQAATDHLVQVMEDLLDKSGGISVKMDEPVDDVGHPVSLTEAAAIEDASRTEFTLGDTVVFYYLVLSEHSNEDTSSFTILGYAYRPSSMVVFQAGIDANAGGLGQPSRDIVESTVVAHEFGHILGLVNAGTPMQTSHEDSKHPKHDVNTACLMYYANNSSAGLANLLTGGNVPDFDDECHADIAALKL